LFILFETVTSDIGNKSFHNYEVKFREATPKNENESLKIQQEIERIESEIEVFKEELINSFQQKFDKEKISMKKVIIKKLIRKLSALVTRIVFTLMLKN